MRCNTSIISCIYASILVILSNVIVPMLYNGLWGKAYNYSDPWSGGKGRTVISLTLESRTTLPLMTEWAIAVASNNTILNIGATLIISMIWLSMLASIKVSECSSVAIRTNIASVNAAFIEGYAILYLMIFGIIAILI